MKKRILAIVMVLAIIFGLMPITVAARPAMPSFEVRYEFQTRSDGVLLFSEEPLHFKLSAMFFMQMAYVFPPGTQIAHRYGGNLVDIFILETSTFMTDRQVMHGPAREMTLTEAMMADPQGVRVVSSRMDGNRLSPNRGLLTILIEEYWDNAAFEAVYDWNRAIRAARSSGPAALEYFTQPTAHIQSDNPAIIDLAREITAGSVNDFQKMQAIHSWVAANIWYDMDTFRGDSPRAPQDALTVLETRRAVCEGYANLSIALHRALGIPAKYVTGFVSGFIFDDEDSFLDLSYTSPSSPIFHAWVEAYLRISGEWVIMDTTWDSFNRFERGVYTPQRANNNRYMNVSLREFSGDHRYALRYDPFVTNVVIPPGAVEIAYETFFRVYGLQAVYIPSSVTYINELAFLFSPGATLFGEAGSYAETFATKNGLRFMVGTPEEALNYEASAYTSLIGTWDRLATLNSIDTFTPRNHRNVNTWTQNILNSRGTRHQRLTFHDNGRVTATGVTGFGNTWTDGSIGGRAYEIRTIGTDDFLFISSPTPGTGGPWTVFVRS